jgi:hypothetical protein
MNAGLLFALTLPGLVVALVVLAVVERLASRAGRRSPLTGRTRPGLSAVGLDALSVAVSPGRAVAVEQREVQEQLRDDDGEGAPPYRDQV